MTGMTGRTDQWFVLVESNTTGSGRLFCACARQLGLRPVVFASNPAKYPYLTADQRDTRQVDTAGVDAVLAACAELGGTVVGVSSSSEYFIGTASRVARTLGLPHADPDAIADCRDKYTQRARLRDAGLPGAAFEAAATPDAAVAAAERIGLPVVVKPIAGSGSIATRRCADLVEVKAAASAVLDVDPATLALPPQHSVMVEEYLSGAEYSVETLDDQVVGVTRKYLGPEPHFVETGHDFPAPLEPAERTAIGDAAVAALRALGLGWGPAHVELRYTPAGGPRIVEVNPRLAGGMIPRAVQEATGVDLIFHVVAKAAGHGVPARPTRSAAASIRFLVADRSGRLLGVDGVAEARRLPGVVEVGLTRQPGQDLVLRHSFQDRLGYVIAAGAQSSVAACAADGGRRALSVRIAPAGPEPAGAEHATEGT